MDTAALHIAAANINDTPQVWPCLAAHNQSSLPHLRSCRRNNHAKGRTILQLIVMTCPRVGPTRPYENQYHKTPTSMTRTAALAISRRDNLS